MAELVKDKRIEGITGLNDETNRKGMRIVVDIRKDANAQVILNQLYQYTQLQDTVGVIMLAIDHKVPKVMTLKQMIQKYVEFQDEVVRRRTQYDLKKAKERAHILEGLKKATDIVDELIATIRACKGGMAEAKAAIMEQFGFDDPQADAIVKLQLGRLAGLEILKIEEELSGLQAKIEDWEDILANDARVLEIVKNELLDMKKRFGDERRTEIQSVTGEVDIEDLIAEEQCVYTLTEAGYIKRQLKATYQAQKRGGRGISGMTRKEEDIVQEMFVGSTHDYVLFVTDKGRLFRIKGYTIAEGSRTSKGSNIVNLLQLAEGEKVTNMLCYPKDEDNKGGFVTMVTKQGLIKRTPLEQYANIRKTGLIGIALNEGDALAWTRLTTGNDMLIVATRNGQAIRFNEADARPMGRSGHGVRAIKLAEGDEVVGVCICREGGTVLTVTENGKGRRSDIDTYRITARGGKGIRNYDASKDKVAAVKIVDDIDDVLLSSQAEAPIPMCGVPWHAAEGYVSQLLNKGYKIAFCDQVEDPRAAKGLVERAVTRVYTPGTAVEDVSLEPKGHTYLGALFWSADTDRGGFAWVDVSTGYWAGLHVKKSFHLVEAALNKHIGNSVFFQPLIQMQMSAADLALTGFDDDPVDILLQQFLQTPCLLAPGVSCIF